MTVQVIRATKQREHTGVSSDVKSRRIRVAAYCRVSTDKEEQESSYAVQCTHYTDYINSNPDWELAGIYADEGISGTSTRRREQFNQMIGDCEAGKIGMVVTKSISRFARNTLDCLKYIRRLKELEIPIYFEKENINTLDTKGEVLITIMASIAQQESQSISQNVRLGIQFNMQNGKGRLNTSRFLGLTKDPATDTLVIVPKEAAIVRRIFREYLEGYSPAMIARHLQSEGVPTPAGGRNWYQSTIASMLENEKYCGDLLLQKYYTVDFLTHRIAKNTGQLPQYYVEDDHEPIIPKSVYFQVQGELMRRSALMSDPTRLRYGSTLALTGRLVCGKCGRILKRYVKPDPHLTDWRCRNRAYTKKSNHREVRSACGCRFARESEVREAIVTALNRLPEYRDELLRRQAAIWNGELKRIDALLGKAKEQQRKLEARRTALEAGETEPGEGEIAFLSDQIAVFEHDRTALVLERADHANRELHIRLLLELAETMKEKETENTQRMLAAYEAVWRQGKENTHERPPAEIRMDAHDAPCTEGCTGAPLTKEKVYAGTDEAWPVACCDYDEFFRRTRYEVPTGILNERGRVVRFDNSMVIRYLDTVTVEDDGYAIHFKAGFSVRVTI